MSSVSPGNIIINTFIRTTKAYRRNYVVPLGHTPSATKRRTRTPDLLENNNFHAIPSLGFVDIGYQDKRYYSSSIINPQNEKDTQHSYIGAIDDDNDNDDNHHEDYDDNITLSALQDCPVGTLTPKQIQDSEHSLINVWAAIRRPKQNDFDTAKFIYQRLVLEHYEYYCNDINDDDKKKNIQQQQQQENEIENYSYRVRPFLLSRLLDCWRRGWRNGHINTKPTDIITWVDELESSYGIYPDSRSLTLIIDGICLRGDSTEAPLLAQWLLDRRMEQLSIYEENHEYNRHNNQDEDDDDNNESHKAAIELRPDTIFITNVIRAWAQSSRVEGPEMAEGLLQLMQDLYNNGWTESGPNAKSYGTTMDAWYKSHHPEAPQRIQNLLDEMKNSNMEQLQPDRVCYQYGINAWVHSKTTNGVEKAHELLQEMIALYKAGNYVSTPNASNFSQVIKGWASRGNSEKMEGVMEQLQDMYSTSGDPNLQPNDECWNAFIIGKAKSGSVKEAQGMLDELIERAISRNDRYLMPSRGVFIDTLVGWTKIKDDLVAAEQSHRLLNRMLELGDIIEYQHLLPDSKTFDKVVLAWSRTRHPKAPHHIENLIRVMEHHYEKSGNERMKPTLFGYTNLMLAWQRSGRNEASGEILKIFDSLQERCNSNHHLCPDKFIFGIVIDAASRQGNYTKAKEIFGNMILEWKNGNSKAKPDARVFHTILEALRSNAITDPTVDLLEQCENYVGMMKDCGLPISVLAHGYLINALSKSGNDDQIAHASKLLDELLQTIEDGRPHRTHPKDYRLFLQMIADSCIPGRNKQAQGLLKTLRWKEVPKDLLPPLSQ